MIAEKLSIEPLPDIVICSECGWRGSLLRCETETDSESWELPEEYTVFICPICKDGGCIDDYCMSGERLEEWKEWKNVRYVIDINRDWKYTRGDGSGDK